MGKMKIKTANDMLALMYRNIINQQEQLLFIHEI